MNQLAIHIIPSGYRCDCGHVTNLTERVVREMKEQSRRKPSRIRDNEKDSHAVEFNAEGAIAVICPRLGRCEITGWE